MVTVNEAKQKIIANVQALSVQTVEVRKALGYVLANDILAPMSLPSFRQSSMDGYAILDTDILEKDTILSLSGESKAGQTITQTLVSGNAIRIFTGAPVPDGATAVVMQENTSAENGTITIREFPVQAGKNVRNIGQQIQKGAVALEGGTFLSPGSIGFLHGMNIWEASVHSKPKVGLLITGDELLHKGDAIVHGKIFESNSSMLAAALEKEGIADLEIKYAEDDLESTIKGLSELAENNDVVLASGGISVGDYDFVGKAVEALGAKTIFYKVRQKPGKPLLFAKRNEKLIFALPGNPASSLVCYYEYVLPALRIMSGLKDPFLTTLKMPVKYAYSFQGERDEFLKGLIVNGEVIPLDGQESFALRSFAIANAIVYLPVEQNVVKEGDLVEVHLLPF
ncbi:molybdopterin molybdotransferase MoeA [Dyadobacter chenwenxiniae]|uniref:Molybdopterin molybdenumtransferase n=1 Tax=Dyadobacter chenwenxiniae TaxID=2906456 RepID=A0A9X1PQ16_9BACT|nr:gephyrin-like molybdotransferase Glp [Dyadobacter chenwenxiniae]MCF0064049.1 molybdopterin molybdotransferase MoeA [Dyadobacter chenwenxiniae]UON82777.1 molybdopterin molybdotransferase MoeA [Dyadobacter chenwenxiniae]